MAGRQKGTRKAKELRQYNAYFTAVRGQAHPTLQVYPRTCQLVSRKPQCLPGESRGGGVTKRTQKTLFGGGGGVIDIFSILTTVMVL